MIDESSQATATEPVNTNTNMNVASMSNAQFAEFREQQTRLAKEQEEREVDQVMKKIAGETFALVKEMMQESGILEVAQMFKGQKAKDNKEERVEPTTSGVRSKQPAPRGELTFSRSETTIYENAVHRQNNPNRMSSSSEEPEPMDTSDETDLLNLQLDNFHPVEPDFLTGAASIDKDKTHGQNTDARRPHHGDNQQQPRRASEPTMKNRMEKLDVIQRQLSPEETAHRLIREAEANKAEGYATPGKQHKSHLHSVLVDEDYLLVASHVDCVTLQKIINGEYMDFCKTTAKRQGIAG